MASNSQSTQLKTFDHFTKVMNGYSNVENTVQRLCQSINHLIEKGSTIRSQFETFHEQESLSEEEKDLARTIFHKHRQQLEYHIGRCRQELNGLKAIADFLFNIGCPF